MGRETQKQLQDDDRREVRKREHVAWKAKHKIVEVINRTVGQQANCEIPIQQHGKNEDYKAGRSN